MCQSARPKSLSQTRLTAYVLACQSVHRQGQAARCYNSSLYDAWLHLDFSKPYGHAWRIIKLTRPCSSCFSLDSSPAVVPGGDRLWVSLAKYTASWASSERKDFIRSLQIQKSVARARWHSETRWRERCRASHLYLSSKEVARQSRHLRFFLRGSRLASQSRPSRKPCSETAHDPWIHLQTQRQFLQHFQSVKAHLLSTCICVLEAQWQIKSGWSSQGIFGLQCRLVAKLLSLLCDWRVTSASDWCVVILPDGCKF